MKIEIDKPMISKFVADWVEEQKEDCDDVAWENNSIYNIVDNFRHDLKMGFVNKKIREWLYSDIKNEIAFEKAIIFSYEVDQAPLYYAKIKAWEHVGTSSYYFGYDEDNDSLEVTYLESNYSFAFSLTKEHWNKLGINDTNADFVEVE